MKCSRLLSSVFVLALLLPGCALLPGGGPAPLDTYELTAPATTAKSRNRGLQILITEPNALKPLDGQNIVIRPEPGVVQFLKGAQWSDRLPRIVQSKLAETFQGSGAFGAVGKPGEGLAIDYQITTEIREFDISLASGGRAAVRLYSRILDDRTGVVRAAEEFSATVPVSGTGNDAFAAALDAAFSIVGRDMVAWADSRL